MAQQDWTSPVTSSVYADVLSELKERDVHLATMFNGYATDTGIPTNTVRYSSAETRFELWDGAAWAELDISSQTVGAGGGATGWTDGTWGGVGTERSQFIQEDIVDASFNKYALTQDINGTTYVNAASGQTLNLQIAASTSLSFDGTDATLFTRLVPDGATVDLGSTADPFQSVYSGAFVNDGADCVVGTDSAHDLDITTNATVRWSVNATTGAITPFTNETLGTVTDRISAVYAEKLESKSASLVISVTTADDIEFHTNGAKRWEVNPNGGFVPSTDDLQVIGSSTFYVQELFVNAIDADTNRLHVNADVALGTWSGSSGWAYFGHQTVQATTGSYAILQNNAGRTLVNGASGQSLSLRNNNADKMVVDGSTIDIYVPLQPDANLSTNLGASGQNFQYCYSQYFRNTEEALMYVWSANEIWFRANEVSVWLMREAGHFVPLNDNTKDIGETTRAIRTLYVEGGIEWTGTAKPWTFFSYTTRASLNPSGATAQQCADSINTLAQYLHDIGILN